MTDLRVVFLGNDRWSVPALEALADLGPRPVLVATRDPRPAGRGSTLRATAVARYAVDTDLPLLETATVRSGPGLDILRNARPDVIAVVAYGELLPPEVLELPPLGCVNLHLSLLPRWRGAAPVQRALLEGDPVAGVSVMVMDEGLDTGPVLSSAREPVAPDDDAGALGGRLAEIGAAALREALLGLEAGTLRPVPQPAEGVTYAPKITAEERSIVWADDAHAVGRRVRALAPDPGASTRFRGRGLKVLRGTPVAFEDAADPGQILREEPAGVTVATGAGAYRIEAVSPAGRKPMSADAWARGARILADERLG